jgi:shikimate dehydrogenase
MNVHLKITAKTRVVGVFGHPVHHSLSPPMHNAAFEALGLDYRYFAFDVRPEMLRRAVEGLRALQMVGVNVTIPHKEKVIRYLDQLSPEARLMGAVNTIENRDGQLIGHNTDGMGFILAFQEAFGQPVEGRRVLLLGAGGAARAVAIQLMSHGVSEMIIANRTYVRARRLVKAITENFPGASALAIRLQGESLKKFCLRADLLINATSTGLMADSSLNFSPSIFRSSMLVCDLTYNPPQTPFLKMAASADCKTMNGVGMLLHQGALAFRIWTGREAPLSVMRAALEQAIEEHRP